MNTQHLTVFTVLFLLCWMKPIPVANACGYPYFYEDERVRDYSITNTNILKDANYQPFFYSSRNLYTYDWDGEGMQQKDNLAEWHDYFDKKPSKKDIAHIVYKASIKDLERIKNRDFIDNTALQNNSLVEYLSANSKKAKPFLAYLKYAKQCEPLATGDLSQWDQEAKYKMTHDQLLKEGPRYYQNCNDAFLQLRYAYLIVRLASYGGENDKAKALYKELVERNSKVKSVKSIMQYWAMEHYANALKSSPEGNAQSAYLYAQIFDKCPSKRMSTYRRFSIRTDKEWSEALSYCKNGAEKASLYMMRAIDPLANVAEEMGYIYEASPNSKSLEFLLIREVQKLERDILGKDAIHRKFNKEYEAYSGYDSNYELQDNKIDGSQLIDLMGFVNKVTKEDKTKRPHFWKMIEAYLAYLDGDLVSAKKGFEILKGQSNLDKTLRTQINQFEFGLAVASVQELDDKTERKIFEHLKKVRPNFAKDKDSLAVAYMLDYFASVYTLQEDYGKAFLCQHDFRHLLLAMDEKVVNDLLALADKTNLNPMEKYLFSRLNCYDEMNWESSKNSLGNTKEYLLEMKGTILLGECRFKESIAAFEQLSDKTKKNYWRFKLGHWNDPFDAKTRYDRRHYYGEEDERHTPLWTKLDLAKKLRTLEVSTKKGSKNGAENYYKLGVAAFNMSYYGNTWRAADYWHEYHENYEEKPLRPQLYKDKNHMDCKASIGYLKKALELAKTDELKAKCYVMLGRCARVQYRSISTYYNNKKHLAMAKTWKENAKKKYRGYISKLDKEFAHTEYYKEAIRECGSVFGYMQY